MALALVEAANLSEEELALLSFLLEAGLHLHVRCSGALLALRHVEGDLVAFLDAKAAQVILQQEDVGSELLVCLRALDEAPALVAECQQQGKSVNSKSLSQQPSWPLRLVRVEGPYCASVGHGSQRSQRRRMWPWLETDLQPP